MPRLLLTTRYVDVSSLRYLEPHLAGPSTYLVQDDKGICGFVAAAELAPILFPLDKPERSVIMGRGGIAQ